MPTVLAQSNLPKSAAVVVSSETIILRDPNNSILEKYTSDEQKQLSLKSYGIKPSTLLSPGTNKKDPSKKALIFYDWIQNDGVAYIDTGFLPSMKNRYIAELEYVQTLPNYFLGCSGPDVSSEDVTSRFMFNGTRRSGSTEEFHLYLTGSSTFLTIPFSNNGKVKFDIHDGIVNVDDSNDYVINNFNANLCCSLSIAIFGRHFPSSFEVSGISRFYSFKAINENGVTVIDLKPATLDDVPGVYDNITGRFYANSAESGSLVVGNGQDFPTLNISNSILGATNIENSVDE